MQRKSNSKKFVKCVIFMFIFHLFAFFISLMVILFPSKYPGIIEVNIVTFFESVVKRGIAAIVGAILAYAFRDEGIVRAVSLVFVGNVINSIISFCSNIIVGKLPEKIDDGLLSRNIDNTAIYFISGLLFSLLILFAYKFILIKNKERLEKNSETDN